MQAEFAAASLDNLHSRSSLESRGIAAKSLSLSAPLSGLRVVFVVLAGRVIIEVLLLATPARR